MKPVDERIELSLRNAYNLAERGEGMDAMLLIDSILDEYPDHPEALTRVCNLLLDMDCIIQAEAVFQHILNLDELPVGTLDLCVRFSNYGNRVKIAMPQYAAAQEQEAAQALGTFTAGP